MNRALKVTRLHLNKWENIVATPPGILAVVLVVSIVIQLAILRATGMTPETPGYIESARYNSGVVWSLPGFLIYYGVQAVAMTYPFALALGTTRRNFIVGTLLANVLQSAYTALLLLALLGVELATGHWFAGVYVLDVYALGSGNPLLLLLLAFSGTLFCLTTGGLFGAVWVRFGSRGPLVLGLVLGLSLALTVLIVAPSIANILAGLSYGRFLTGVGVVILLAIVGTWFAMRRASVR